MASVGETSVANAMDGLEILKDKTEKCLFCKLKDVNELKYGPLYKREGLVAHYYCVLFSYRVIQNGADDEGILGFLISDIKNELRRVKNIKCYYCSKTNASVYCANPQCGKIFHFPCGIKRKSLHQYKGSFKSYCCEHRPKQKIPVEYLTEAQNNKTKCVICYEDMDCSDETEVVWANCCLKTWYHRDCLQKFALSSGYLFKCAICNNRRQFKQWVEEYGIFVPKQDASWELEPGAFSELLVQHARCDAAECRCPYGREFSSEFYARQWELALCKSCGSQGIHPACSSRAVTVNWECELCKIVRKNLKAKRAIAGNNSQSDAGSSSQDSPARDVDPCDIAQGDVPKEEGRFRIVRCGVVREDDSSSNALDSLIGDEDSSNTMQGGLLTDDDPCNIAQGGLIVENDDFRNIATSSLSRNLSAIVAAATTDNFARMIRGRAERKRKRTDSPVDVSDLKKTAFASEQSQDEGSQDSTEKDDTAGSAHSSTSQPNTPAQEVTGDEAVDMEVPTESNEANDETAEDGAEETYMGTSSNEDIEESKKKDQGIVLIDLTEAANVDKDEIITVMETYRNIQLTDVRYRVKKEVYVLSDDDGENAYDNDGDGMDDEDKKSDDDDDDDDDDDELEIILHKYNLDEACTSGAFVDDTDAMSPMVIEEPGVWDVPDVPDISAVEQVGDDPQDKEVKPETEAKTSEDGSVKANEGEDEDEVEVLKVVGEGTSNSQARSTSYLMNEVAGTSSRAAGPSDEKVKSELLDKYFIIFLEENRNRTRLDRFSRDIRSGILGHNQRYGSRHPKSSVAKQGEEDENSHITLSSDSDTEHAAVNGAGGEGDDDDVQIIDNATD